MDNKSKKPTHSVLSNSIWIYKMQWEYCKPLFAALLIMIPVGLGIKYLNIYLPKLVVQLVLDKSDVYHAVMSVVVVVAIMLVLNAISGGYDMISFYWFTDLRVRFFNKIVNKAITTDYQNLEKTDFMDIHSRGEATLWASGVHSPLTRMSSSTAELIQCILGCILFGSIISFANPWIAVALIFTPFITWYFTQRYNKYEYANREKWTPLDRKIKYILNKSSDFSSAKDIRIYSLKDWFFNAYKAFTKERIAWDKRLLKKSLIPCLSDLLIVLLRDGISYYILISMALRGKITIDSFVLYFAAVGSFASMVGGVFEKWNKIHSISLSICDLRDYFEYPDRRKRDKGVDVKTILTPCSIDLDNVGFRYNKAEKDTIQGISLHIRPGEKLAIVGLNGAGKTTLVKTICGLYDTSYGNIKVSGYDIKEYNIFNYYSLFSTVFQDSYLLPISIAETVSSKTRENTDDERVVECLKLAGLWDKISTLPDGINTPLNKQLFDNGIELSGGQKQKLMLAKAIYKSAPILILDEPTAALDPIAENEMYLRYNELTKGRTSIFISHRLSSTRFCDRIIFLEDGRIVEEGTHEELMKLGGKYADMFELQSHYYKEGEIA